MHRRRSYNGIRLTCWYWTNVGLESILAGTRYFCSGFAGFSDPVFDEGMVDPKNDVVVEAGLQEFQQRGFINLEVFGPAAGWKKCQTGFVASQLLPDC